MTYSAPSDYYDDGLVHSHDWARNTPPGGKHGDRANTRSSHTHDHDEGLVHEHRWARS